MKKNKMITGMYLMLSMILWLTFILVISAGLKIQVNDWYRLIWWSGGVLSLYVIRPTVDNVMDIGVIVFMLIMGPIGATTIGMVYLHAKLRNQ